MNLQKGFVALVGTFAILILGFAFIDGLILVITLFLGKGSETLAPVLYPVSALAAVASFVYFAFVEK